ncbi:hypothetical protein O6H91_23G013000 [Diphasiastrum complanatum]|uniref:Uncharacterized protein n=1 Tax=Diphasiastrum complanatum TaxID=34168 RepID=A0ACC2A9F5_DIPCM|nr:hypothetical protein O6H91_23G013000 [Diphasiastrum complanatum]
MMSSSEITAKTSSKSVVQPVFTYKYQVLFRLCLAVICSSFIVVFLFTPNRVLPKFVALFNNEVPKITRVLRTWLTPAFFFVLLNLMVAVILIQSGLFALTEKHSSSIHEESECSENVSLKESSETGAASANTVAPKSEREDTILENPNEEISSQNLTLKSKDSESAVSTFRVISQKSAKSATKAKLSRSTRSVPESHSKNGHQIVVNHEIDELNERIEAFISKARQQMRQQEQQASRLFDNDGTRNPHGW